MIIKTSIANQLFPEVVPSPYREPPLALQPNNKRTQNKLPYVFQIKKTMEEDKLK